MVKLIVNINVDMKKTIQKDWTQALTEATRYVHRVVNENFAADGRPPWAPLSPKYLKYKTSKGYPAKIMQKTGILMNSIKESITRNVGSVYTNVPYAIYHHFGYKTRIWGRPVRVPARPLFVLSDDNIKNIVAIFNKHAVTTGGARYQEVIR